MDTYRDVLPSITETGVVTCALWTGRCTSSFTISVVGPGQRLVEAVFHLHNHLSFSAVDALSCVQDSLQWVLAVEAVVSMEAICFGAGSARKERRARAHKPTSKVSKEREKEGRYVRACA